MNELDRVLASKAIDQLSGREQKRASQILEALEGMSIGKAQKLLDTCKDALLVLQIKF